MQKRPSAISSSQVVQHSVLLTVSVVCAPRGVVSLDFFGFASESQGEENGNYVSSFRTARSLAQGSIVLATLSLWSAAC